MNAPGGTPSHDATSLAPELRGELTSLPIPLGLDFASKQWLGNSLSATAVDHFAPWPILITGTLNAAPIYSRAV